MKIALFIYTALEGHGNPSKVYRALQSAAELGQAGHDVKIIFDGAGTETLALISEPSHRFHRSLEAVRTLIEGACAVCAKSYDVNEKLEQAGFTLLRDYKGEASLNKYLVEGYQIITY
jgi:hypothetical protein